MKSHESAIKMYSSKEYHLYQKLPQCNLAPGFPTFLSQTESAWEFQRNALWNTHQPALISVYTVILDWSLDIGFMLLCILCIISS